MRVSVQLIDAATGYQRWSRSYDRQAGDILQLQGDIAEAVSGVLRLSLGAADAARLTAGGTTDPTALDDFLRGMLLLRSGSDSSFAGALALFDQAVARDPGFARAHSGRAYALLNIAMTTNDDAAGRRTFADALAAASHAIALAPDIATGYAARASVLDNGYLDPNGAVAEIRKALALEPGNAAVRCRPAARPVARDRC